MGSVLLLFSALFAYVVSAHDSLRQSGYLATDPPTWVSEHSYLAFNLLVTLCLVAGALCELNGLSLRDTDPSLALFMLLEGAAVLWRLILGFVGWSDSLIPISSGE